MIVSELINILSALHSGLKVIIGVDESLEHICFSDSGPIQVKFNNRQEK